VSAPATQALWKVLLLLFWFPGKLEHQAYERMSSLCFYRIFSKLVDGKFLRRFAVTKFMGSQSFFVLFWIQTCFPDTRDSNGLLLWY
jgi:hypothetical protein